MCGIVGYVGSGQAAEVLFQGLRKLEYRGYDSAGICVVDDGALVCRKVAGNLDAMETALDGVTMSGRVGIAHTRWATHGAPNEMNAHPHLDCHGEIAVAHNGIIENYLPLREKLERRGHVFRSQTDTETIAHLIEEHYDGDLGEALRLSLLELEGSYAVVAIHRRNPGVIAAARRDSPLCVGIGRDEYLVASAVPAFLDRTREVLFLEDGEAMTIDGSGLSLFTLDGAAVTRDAVRVEWSLDAAEKGGFEDFMLKEIFEQPAAVADTIADKFDADGSIELGELGLTPASARGLHRVVVVACGTAFHAGLLAKYAIEHWAGLPVEVDQASEFRYRDLSLTDRDLVIAVSQSGETMDTLAGVREAVRLQARVVAVVNTVGSQMTREAHGVILTHAGPEIGVAATKTFAAQMTAVYLLALRLGTLRGTLSAEMCRPLVDALKEVPEKIQEMLSDTAPAIEAARKYHGFDDFLFLGRSVSYPIAMEGALKLKEISYIHAEGYPAGEMKHGPIALLEPGCPVVAVAPGGPVYDKMLSNIEEVRARNAPVLAVATRGDAAIEEMCDDVLWVPETHEMLSPMLTVVPLQMFAYHCAKMRGCNVDQPRNLAKTVTVE